jgi:hypothetical protein
MSNPYATGGGGVTLERRVAALWLARLLTGDTAPELGDDRRVVGVAFQQEPAIAVDDLVIHAARGDEPEASLQLAIAVRRRPNVVTSNTDAQKFVADLVRALDQTSADDDMRHRLAVAVAGPQPHADQLAELAALARNQRDATGFFSLIEEPERFRKALRERLRHIEALVKASLAADDDDPNPGTVLVRRRTWELLVRLHVLEVRVEEPDATDWTAAQSRLAAVARGRDLAGAGRLLERLESLAAHYATTAARVDVPLLQRAVHHLLELGVTRSHRGWSTLKALDASARQAVRDRVGAAEPSESVHIDREAQAEDLLARADVTGAVVVTGESGVGKSALALAAADRARRVGRASEPAEATCINHRHLPSTWLELQQILGAPLAELLAQMSAPHRYLVVDAADAAAESGGEMLTYLVDAAVSSAVCLIVVTSADGRPTVSEVLEDRLATEPKSFEVSPLDDATVTKLAARFPRLQRLAQSPRARELLRRLVVVDLLLRSDVVDTPLNAAEAMREIWGGLIRRNERRDRGLPDAREQALLRLAAHELRRAPVGDLDPEALGGLRRDGLVRAMHDAWPLEPQFAHDEVRRFAVARLLAAEEDVAAAVLDAAAPRWALGAATLALQLQISRPPQAIAGAPRRFDALQASFDAVAAAGHSERWADVPTEALLTLTDPAPLLADAEPTLLASGAAGLKRLLRLLYQRHANTERLPALPVADALVGLLLKRERPWMIASDAARLLRGWLIGMDMADTPAGHAQRLILRDRLVEAVKEGDQRLADGRAERETARSNQTAEERERARVLEERRRPLLKPPPGLDRPARRKPELPSELIDRTVIELLALLGPDLGQAGEQLLRRLAADAPERLWPALEQPGTARALRSYGHGLLVDLAEAYYLNDDEDDDSFGLRIDDDGVRSHHSLSVPIATYSRGPFLALFQSDFRSGVSMLNRLLNHATRTRARALRGLLADTHPGAAPDYRFEFDLTGEPHTYLGDDHVWRWYRGTGSGPYPCMSALQALERVCDQLLADEAVTLPELVALFLEDCENLAMPGLVAGLLVRHIERAGDLLDPFLADPAIWQLETRRMVTEQSSLGLTADSTGLVNPERRRWTFRETATAMTAFASPDRAEALRAVGERLIARAQERSSGDNPEYVAMVQIWAATLDQATYQVTTRDGQTYLGPTPPQDAQQALASGNADLQRGNELTQLQFKYLAVGKPWHSPGPPPDGPDVEADLERARSFLVDPPEQSAVPARDVAAVVASYALAGLAAGEFDLDARSRAFAVEVVLSIIETLGPADPQNTHRPSSDMDADRQIARVLPAMLAAGATQTDGGDDAHPRVVAAGRRLAQSSATETRIGLAIALDDVWRHPCTASGDCWHRDALGWVIESMRDCVLGPWGQHGQRTIERLGDPVVEALAAVPARDVYVGRLDAGLRALGAAATSGCCVADEARALVLEALTANRRGTLAHEKTYDTYGTHARMAGRTLLALAADGEAEPLWQHLDAFADRPSDLNSLLRGLTGLAAQSEKAGAAARALWPRVVERVLSSAGPDREHFADGLSGSLALTALLPSPGDPVAWTDPIGWTTTVDVWIAAAAGTQHCADAFIGFIAALPTEQQATFGVPRIARLVSFDPKHASHQSRVVGAWLVEIQDAAMATGVGQIWQQVVDDLVVAGNSELSAFSE